MFSSLPDLQKERGFPHPSRKKKLLQSKRESTLALRNCHSEVPKAVLSIAKEESRMFMKMYRARSFAQFTLSGKARFFVSLRMTAKGSG